MRLTKEEKFLLNGYRRVLQPEQFRVLDAVNAQLPADASFDSIVAELQDPAQPEVAEALCLVCVLLEAAEYRTDEPLKATLRHVKAHLESALEEM